MENIRLFKEKLCWKSIEFCEKFSINVNELIRLTNKHPRVNILDPGCGVGGHCIAVDPWFIASAEPKLSNLIQSARRVNLYKTEWVIEKISNKINMMQMTNIIVILKRSLLN